MLFALLTTVILAQDQKSRVEGQVLSLAGTPLKKSTVRLEAASQMNQSNFANYAAASDKEGKFVFEDVTPGTYILSAERTGYLRRYYGARSTTAGATQIKLDAGQVMKDVVIKLTPQGMIFGRVVDEDGDPLPWFSVQASHWMFVRGKKELQSAGSQTSQADGTFVLGGLPVGRYYLSAEDQSHGWNDRIEQSGNKKPVESYLKTYFPNVLDVSSATLIDAASGAEVRGIEIHVRRGRVFEIRGKVENGLGGAAPRWTNLELVPKTSPGFGRKQAMSNDKGDFQFKDVVPGLYTIYAEGGMETKDSTGEFTKSTALIARLEITVADRNVENVAVQLNPGVEIKGAFKMEAADPASQTTAAKFPTSIQLVSIDDPEDGGGYWQAKADGTFRLQGLSPGVVRVSLHGLEENLYLKALSLGGREVKGKDLDLTSGSGGEMEILLSPNGAEVTGIVRDADAKPVPGAVVQICEKDGAVVKTVNADLNGLFDLKGLAPGDYKVFSWEDLGDGIVTDPDFRKSFESKAAAVTLAEKGRENVELTVIAKDAMDAEAVKIR